MVLIFELSVKWADYKCISTIFFGLNRFLHQKLKTRAPDIFVPFLPNLTCSHPHEVSSGLLYSQQVGFNKLKKVVHNLPRSYFFQFQYNLYYKYT